jgi:hypothetical protein
MPPTPLAPSANPRIVNAAVAYPCQRDLQDALTLSATSIAVGTTGWSKKFL